MKFTEYPQGTPCWVDLGSSDLAASVAFYSGLFGWRAEASPDPQYGGYTMFHIGDDAVAAAAPLRCSCSGRSRSAASIPPASP